MLIVVECVPLASARTIGGGKQGLQDVDLHYVGRDAIDGNDDLHQAASNETTLEQYVELVQSLELRRRRWSEDGWHRCAADTDLHRGRVGFLTPVRNSDRYT